MFCTECGQSIADDAKFCAYCGTRRTIPASGAPAAAPPARSSSPEPPPSPRPVRSTAEIMPIRMQGSPLPRPRVSEAGPVEPEQDEPAVPWPAEERTPPPLFGQQPQVAAERPPVRFAAPPPPVYSAPAPAPAYTAAPPAATDAPAP